VNRTIVFIEQFFWPDGWGGAQIPRDLACHLARAGYDVEVICGSDPYAPVEGTLPPDPRDSGVRIRRIPKLFGGSIHQLKLLRQLWFYAALVPLLLLRRRPALLIQQTNPPLSIVIGAVAAALWRRPSIIIAMDIYPEILVAHGATSAEGFVTRLLRRVFRWSYRTARRVVALGPVARERLIAKGVEPGNIVTIPNWSTGSEGIVRGAANRLLAEWGLAGKFVVLYSGNLGIAHEFDTFLEGFAAACRAVPELYFVIIGKGSRLAEVRAAVERLGLAVRVRFAGLVPAERMPETIGLADIALVTLRDGFEGLVVPSKLYGYLSRAVPVLCVGPRSDVSITVEESGCGVTAGPGEADKVAQLLAALAADRARLTGLGEAGARLYNDEFTAAHAFARYSALVDSLIGSGGRG
jgi:colanic acid biosynthesis glycosyl transferase WcaI